VEEVTRGSGATLRWLDYFERKREQDPWRSIAWEEGLNVEATLRGPLIRSLQRFQVGETGDGAHLAKNAARTGDKSYLRAIQLFVEEEREHAEILERILGALDAPLLDRHWSDTVFVALRRVMGLRTELMILLIAEMIARRYYRALLEGTRDPVLRDAFTQILRDEAGHVTFHGDYLRSRFVNIPAPVRSSIRFGWKGLFRLVCIVVMWDHRAVLRATRVSPPEFWRDCGIIFDSTARHIFSASQDPA
jgi:hypothetical protein